MEPFYVLISTFLQVLLILTCSVDASPTGYRHIANIKRSAAELAESYDYVIIGGGQSGLVVADRLSEDGTKTVLVVEYGDIDNNKDILLPSTGAASLGRDFFNFSTAVNYHLNNKTFAIQAAAVVGGGSAVNGMLLDRGAAEDYDNWEKLGNPGWGFEDLLPYFRKSTTLTLPNKELQQEFGIVEDESAYGDGPIYASYPPWQWPGTKAQVNAWKELGVKSPAKASSGDAVGVFWAPSALDPRTWTRSYAKTAYHDRAAPRDNYDLLTKHEVLTIKFTNSSTHDPLPNNSTSTLRATSITFRNRGTREVSTVSANKEIILAAGTFHSPIILQRSGVGHFPLIDRAKIPRVLEVPGVGVNLQDHAYMTRQYDYNTNVSPNPDMLDRSSPKFNQTFYDWAQAEYTNHQRGPLTVATANTAAFLSLNTAVANTDTITSSTSRARSQISLPGTYTTSLRIGFNMQESTVLSSLSSPASAALAIPFTGKSSSPLIMLKPLSRGTVSLDRAAPFETPPLVDFRTFYHPVDLQLFIEIFKFSRKWFEAPAHRKLGPVETAMQKNAVSDAQIELLLREKVLPSSGDAVGTCAMMPFNRGGVVGPDLRVYETMGLSIVDASIIPLIPGAHLGATVYAVAEKAADLIKARA
ncbi:GMC oxidoreductase [Patellaria atrata CBS 101060]|uniref:GMC oxidoreductase n=1 Tax=Patellaria atrata CBS 101060 TaxID=1346257 RepID=A0A9P4SI97_9PEZI|nr:GMC oxidoreductase [Patellaria atrata CBS 101060]